MINSLLSQPLSSLSQHLNRFVCLCPFLNSDSERTSTQFFDGAASVLQLTRCPELCDFQVDSAGDGFGDVSEIKCMLLLQTTAPGLRPISPRVEGGKGSHRADPI